MSMNTTLAAQYEAVQAVRKFLTCDRDSVSTFEAITAFEDEVGGIGGDFGQRFCDATGFDPEPLLDTDGEHHFDVDSLMDLAADIEDFEFETATGPQHDTWEESRGER